MSVKKNKAKADIFLAKRRSTLTTDHQTACQWFEESLQQHLNEKRLNEEQAGIVMEHVVRLAERERNAPNTGNLLDLFNTTLLDTKDPCRAFAQVLADSVKVVPMPQETTLLPPMKDIRKDSKTSGKILKKVKDLPLAPPQQMLASHTNVAYADEEMAQSARAMIASCHKDLSKAEAEKKFYQMWAQSQHMPSSSFVLAACSGLSFQVEGLYKKAGFDDKQAKIAQGFYDVSAHFNPKWLSLFMNPGPRDDKDYQKWLKDYHKYRKDLHDELKYQLTSDTLTNFHPGTMNSGKWVDAAVMFSNVKKEDDIPEALSKIVNQYLAEFVDLHHEPADIFIESVSKTLKDYGVTYDKKKELFVSQKKKPTNHKQLAAQFEAAWHKKIVSGVIKSSPLFQRLGESLSSKLLECFERTVFTNKDVILKEGQPGLGLFVIVDGSVEVTFKNGTSESVTLNTGEVFGEISLLSDDVTTAKVTATEDTVTLLLTPKRFREIVEDHHDVQDFLVKLAEERLSEIKKTHPREWRIAGKK